MLYSATVAVSNSCLSAALLVALAVSGGSFARYGYCC